MEADPGEEEAQEGEVTMVGMEVHATANYPGIGPVVEQWEGIGKACGVSRWTVQRWARRRVDPLPARRIGKTVYCVIVELEDWMQRNQKAVAP